MNHRLILATALALSAPAAFCQAPAAPPQDAQQGPRQTIIERRQFMGGPGEPGMPPMEGGMRDPRRMNRMHGTWWKNPETAQLIALTPDQIKKLDDISLQGKITMIHLRATLEEQELLLKPTLEAPTPDEKKADLQIDKIAETRASIEKAVFKEKLALRAVLTPEQWTKLHEDHFGEGPEEMRHHHHPDGSLCPGCPPGGDPGGWPKK